MFFAEGWTAISKELASFTESIFLEISASVLNTMNLPRIEL
jgi:hypothetical protein